MVSEEGESGLATVAKAAGKCPIDQIVLIVMLCLK